MRASMRFEGGQELASVLSKLSTRVSKRVATEALTAAAEPVRLTASRLAPRRPPQPDLADHIIVANARTREGETAAVKVGPEIGYQHGFFQELGTIHHAAQPFLRPAFDQHWRTALGIVRDAFWTTLASVGVSRSATVPSRPSAPDGGDLL